MMQACNRILAYCVGDTANYLTHQAKEYLFNHYSPWTFAQAITEEYSGEKLPSVISKRICDLGHLCYAPSMINRLYAIGLIFRTVHLISDPNLIKQGLKLPRNGKEFSVYPTVIDTVIDSSNLLTCHEVHHRRLRKPFEGILSIKEIEANLLPEIARDLIRINISSTRPLRERFDQFTQNPGKAQQSLEALSEAEVASSENAVLTASEHTTSITRQFTKTLLHSYPEWRKKIISEWKIAFGEFDNHVVEEDHIQRLITFVKGGDWQGQRLPPSPSLHAFVLEALRLFPVVPFIVRVANKDLNLGEEEIKQGDVVVFNILGFQRGNEIFGENLMEFNPNRFFKENGDAPNILKDKLDILNFSIGSQHCIGKNLARYNLLLATVVDAIIIELESSKISAKKYFHGNKRTFEGAKFGREIQEKIELSYYIQSPSLKNPEEGTLPSIKCKGPFLALNGELEFNRVIFPQTCAPKTSTAFKVKCF